MVKLATTSVQTVRSILLHQVNSVYPSVGLFLFQCLLLLVIDYLQYRNKSWPNPAWTDTQTAGLYGRSISSVADRPAVPSKRCRSQPGIPLPVYQRRITAGQIRTVIPLAFAKTFTLMSSPRTLKFIISRSDILAPAKTSFDSSATI